MFPVSYNTNKQLIEVLLKIIRLKYFSESRSRCRKKIVILILNNILFLKFSDIFMHVRTPIYRLTQKKNSD